VGAIAAVFPFWAGGSEAGEEVGGVDRAVSSSGGTVMMELSGYRIIYVYSTGGMQLGPFGIVILFLKKTMTEVSIWRNALERGMQSFC
jgi:hypothetical protein